MGAIVLCVIALLLAAAGFLLFAPVRLHIRHDKHLTIALLFCKKRIRLWPAPHKEKPKAQGFIQGEEEKQAGGISPGTIFRILPDVLAYCRTKIRVEHFDFHLLLGLSDAAKTAITAGAAWGLVYTGLGLVDRAMELEKTNVQIVPVYDRETAQLTLDSIIRTRPVHIITIAFYIIKQYTNQKRKDDM